MVLPTSMKAIKVVEAGKAEVQEVPLPKLRDGYVLVKTNYVALNPTDWKHINIAALATPGCTVGCDYAGIVEQVGPGVTKDWKKGDRIAGFVHGVNGAEKEDGCFAQYCVAKGDVQMRIPEALGDEEAVTLGVGVTTVGQGLYQSLGLSLPGEVKSAGEKVWLLVYGASTATGSLAVQFGVLSGCDVIAICSEKNFAFVKSLGASAAFDYKDPECSKKIRAYTNDNLTHVFDCISEGASPKICEEAISSRGGTISYLLGPPENSRKDVERKHTLGYSYTGEGFPFAGSQWPPKPEDFEFAKMFWPLAEKLIASKQISVHPPTLCQGGLSGIFDGMQQLKEGKVSGTKLVYKIE